MDIKDLSLLAKAHEEALLAQHLTCGELVALLALITARIYAKVYSDVGKREVTSTAGPETGPGIENAHIITPVKPAKPVSYDPVYDPEPPFTPDKPPERNSPVRVLADANHACICAACNKVGYTTNRVIYDGDKVTDFLAAYTPLPTVPALTRQLEISNVDGQISIDCPFCHANKSMYLTGRPVHL